MKKADELKQVRQSLFESQFSIDRNALDFYSNYRLPNEMFLPMATVDQCTINASVLQTLDRIYNHMVSARKQLHGPTEGLFDTVTAACNRFRDLQEHTLPASSDALKRKLMDFKKRGYEALIHGNLLRQTTARTIGNGTAINDSDRGIGKSIHIETNAPQCFAESNDVSGIVDVPDHDFARKHVARSRRLVLAE